MTIRQRRRRPAIQVSSDIATNLFIIASFLIRTRSRRKCSRIRNWSIDPFRLLLLLLLLFMALGRFTSIHREKNKETIDHLQFLPFYSTTLSSNIITAMNSRVLIWPESCSRSESIKWRSSGTREPFIISSCFGSCCLLPAAIKTALNT